MKSLALAIALFASACASGPKPAKGLTLATPEGQPFALEQLAGKVVLLDFWATWCQPCRATLPSTQRLAEKLAARGLVTYVVNVEKQSVDVAPFLKELRISLPVLRDPDGAQAEKLGGANLPFAVLIDRRGQVRFRHEGAPDGLEETLGKEAEALVAESAQ